MVHIRQFEERMEKLFASGAIPGFVHLGIGQEACMAGVCFNLEDGDTVGATHREHGVLLCRGVDPYAITAEMYGKATGICKGKGGHLHVCGLKWGALGNNAVLGPAQTIVNGFAYANKVRKNGKVAVSMFGDGASNRGEFHEGLNFAATWNLPSIFVLSNNGYAISVAKHEQQKIEDLSSRAAAYGIPGVQVDGNDIITVVETIGEAVKRARSGGGPSLIELKTYRWKGHFEGDSGAYRPAGELDEWMKKDPILRFEKVLLERKVATQADFDAISKEIAELIDKYQKFAEDSPYPDLSEIYTDIFYHDEGGVQQ
jgi:pyruvate dehydrogenase E1 component alpha subunit